jgi:hypothetical protein
MKYEAPKMDLVLLAEDAVMGSFDMYSNTINLWDMLVDET